MLIMHAKKSVLLSLLVVQRHTRSAVHLGTPTVNMVSKLPRKGPPPLPHHPTPPIAPAGSRSEDARRCGSWVAVACSYL